MTHWKTLGLAALAVVVPIALVGVSSASALQSGSFTATGGGGKKIETSVVQQHVWTVTGSSLKCNKIVYEGSTEGSETTSQTVTPSYSECTSFGLPSIITNNNCKLRFTATTDKEGGHADAHLEGPECTLTITAKNIFGECITELTPQTIKVHYVNNVSPEGLTWQFTSGGTMTDHVTKSTGVCPLTVGTHTNASYTGEERIMASGGIQYMETASAGAP